MSTELHRPTAKIYTFPSGGRAPPPRYREDSKSTLAPRRRDSHDERLARVEYGNCWYHEAAVSKKPKSAGSAKSRVSGNVLAWRHMGVTLRRGPHAPKMDHSIRLLRRSSAS